MTSAWPIRNTEIISQCVNNVLDFTSMHAWHSIPPHDLWVNKLCSGKSSKHMAHDCHWLTTAAAALLLTSPLPVYMSSVHVPVLSAVAFHRSRLSESSVACNPPLQGSAPSADWSAVVKSLLGASPESCIIVESKYDIFEKTSPLPVGTTVPSFVVDNETELGSGFDSSIAVSVSGLITSQELLTSSKDPIASPTCVMTSSLCVLMFVSSKSGEHILVVLLLAETSQLLLIVWGAPIAPTGKT